SRGCAAAPSPKAFSTRSPSRTRRRRERCGVFSWPARRRPIVIWLNPAVLFALLAVAVPVLIHILVQRRAERFAFPTLRFLRPTRLAAIRRHVIDDVVLLAIRAAIIAAAVAAVAGPLLVTTARRAAWNRRIVRAVVAAAPMPAESDREHVFQAIEFTGPSLPDPIRPA